MLAGYSLLKILLQMGDVPGAWNIFRCRSLKLVRAWGDDGLYDVGAFPVRGELAFVADIVDR